MLYHLRKIVNCMRQMENALMSHIFGPFPPRELIIATEMPFMQSPRSPYSLKDLIGDGFLFAVPKSRRTVEKRLKRKFGNPEYVLKILQPKTNIKVCTTCGHHHERSVLCANCYNRVVEETKEIQAKMQSTGLQPIEKDVIVLYEGESLPEQPSEFYKGRRIIEMKKPRPQFFSKNLLQKTTQQPSESTDVKPNELA